MRFEQPRWSRSMRRSPSPAAVVSVAMLALVLHSPHAAERDASAQQISPAGSADGDVQASEFASPARLASPSTTPDEMGDSVAVDGNFAFVGQPAAFESPFLAPGPRGGRVHVYKRSASVWSLHSTLAGDGAFNQFGGDVSMFGTLAIVGASHQDHFGSSIDENQGAAYIYEYSSSTDAWIRRTRLTAPDAAMGDFFGCG